jgi:hypothetical protein
MIISLGGMDDDAGEPTSEPEPEPEPESGADGSGETPGWERPIDKFKRSSVGSVVAAGLLGVRDALEGRPEKEEVTIVQDAPAQPVRGNIDLVIDPDHPERSIAVIRRPAAPEPEVGGADGSEEQRSDESG